MPDELVTLPEAAKAARVEHRTLHSWVERGIVVPSRPSKGTGHPALLSLRDADICGMLGRLREAGCGMDVLLGAARAAQSQPDLEVVELHRPGEVLIRVPVREPVFEKAKPAALAARPSTDEKGTPDV